MSFSKFFCTAMIATFVLLTGCANNQGGNKEEMQGNTYEKVEMTESEKELMVRISFDKQAAAEGLLEDWQKEILEELRFGNAYLKEKYPNDDMEIVSCETATAVKEYNNYTIIPKDDPQSSYELRIAASEDGKGYAVSDNFYNKVIRDSAQDMITKIVTDAGLPCIKVKASFGAFLGKEYGEGMSVEDVMTGKLEANNTVQIYIEEKKLDHGSYKGNVQEIKDALTENGIKGYFTVIIGTDDSKESVYRESFSIG